MTSWMFYFAWFLSMSIPDNHLRGLLRSWGFFWLFFLSGVFGGGYKVVWWTWGLFTRDLVLKIRPNILGGIPLVAGFSCTFIRYFMEAFLGGPYWSLGYLLWGALNFLEILLPNCEQCSWDYFPYLLVFSYPDEEGTKGWYYLLSGGISFLLLYFLLFGRRGEAKIDVNENFNVRLYLSLIGYLLTILRSDFAKFCMIHAVGMG